MLSQKQASTIDATNTAIAKALGPVRSEYDPDSFAGFSLARCPDTHAITISMPQKVEEATRTHFPDLVTSPTRAPKNPCSEPAIKSLKAVSDQMQLAALQVIIQAVETFVFGPASGFLRCTTPAATLAS